MTLGEDAERVVQQRGKRRVVLGQVSLQRARRDAQALREVFDGRRCGSDQRQQLAADVEERIVDVDAREHALHLAIDEAAQPRQLRRQLGVHRIEAELRHRRRGIERDRAAKRCLVLAQRRDHRTGEGDEPRMDVGAPNPLHGCGHRVVTQLGMRQAEVLDADRVVRLDDREKGGFAGNCIALSGSRVYLSERAADSLTPEHRADLAAWGFELRPVALGEIEKAGGSLRCCVAEIF